MKYGVAIQQKVQAKNYLVAILKLMGWEFNTIGVTSFVIYAKDANYIKDTVAGLLQDYPKPMSFFVLRHPEISRKKIEGEDYFAFVVVMQSACLNFDSDLVPMWKVKFKNVQWKYLHNRVAEGKFDTKYYDSVIKAILPHFCIQRNEHYVRFFVNNIFITVLKNRVLFD